MKSVSKFPYNPWLLFLTCLPKNDKNQDGLAWVSNFKSFKLYKLGNKAESLPYLQIFRNDSCPGFGTKLFTYQNLSQLSSLFFTEQILILHKLISAHLTKLMVTCKVRTPYPGSLSSGLVTQTKSILSHPILLYDSKIPCITSHWVASLFWHLLVSHY